MYEKSMFAYARQDTGECSSEKGCACFCQRDTVDGKCTKGQRDALGLDLYRIKREGKTAFSDESLDHTLLVVLKTGEVCYSAFQHF